MDLDRLRKLYKLAANNSNKNEAVVAALKFIQAIEQQDLNMSFYKGDAPPTKRAPQAIKISPKRLKDINVEETIVSDIE